MPVRQCPAPSGWRPLACGQCPDPDHASEIEVRFTADGAGQTAVELAHRLLERLADGQAARDAIIGGGGGWTGILEQFAKAAANE